jgi:hypothetical protein
MEDNKQSRPRTGRIRLHAGIAVTFIVCAGAVVYANVPKTFSSQTTLTAADLNTNFSDLDSRLLALEGKVIPAGAVMYFNLSACPAGWSALTAAQGRYIVGMPGGGSLAATVGTALSDKENRAVGQHAHTATDAGHSHPISDPGHAHGEWIDSGSMTWYINNVTFGSSGTARGGTNTATTGITATNSGNANVTVGNAGTVAGTNAPFLQLLVCQKT